jgi:hypothetical protein
MGHIFSVLSRKALDLTDTGFSSFRVMVNYVL